MTGEFNILDLLQDGVSAFIGGSAVGAVAFGLSRIPDISGVWTITIRCSESAYNPYLGMTMTYIAMISQHGNSVQGIAEKVADQKHGETINEFVGKGRKTSTIKGGLKGNIFQKKSFNLIFNENGDRRNYASIHSISKKHAECYKGKFSSTAANTSGTTTWTKGIGKYNFKLLTPHE